MAHTHEHDSDTYYLDQLCLVALSGAFGAVCLTLSFWQTEMLALILAPQFHPFVLWSGIALMLLVLVRAVTLWNAVGRTAHNHAQDQDPREHGHCHHDHKEHGHCGHAHHHDHDHAHAVTADPTALPCSAEPHDHGHDHGWAPWRYVILLLPIMLYLLGLPNKPQQVKAVEKLDLTQEFLGYASLLSTGPALEQIVLAAALHADREEGPAKAMDFKTLEALAYTPGDREYWKDKTVQVVGQFAPHPGSDRIFTLVRLRIQCCAADAIQLRVPMICRESLLAIQPDTWVRVTGRVEYREKPGGGGTITVLMVPRRQSVMATSPDPNPYIQ